MIISLSDKIYIDLESVRPILTDLVRAYTYQNPEFYSKQSMGFSVKNDSPIIEHYAIMDKNGKKFLVLPRGSLNKCLQIIKSKNPNTPIRLDDQRSQGYTIDVRLKESTKLESQQLTIIDLLTKNEGGLIEMVPGGGKTISAIGLISRIKKNTLILVHEHRLRTQWEEEIKNRLEGSFVLGRYDGDKKIDGDICIGIINTVYNLYKLDKNFLSKFGMIIVDEAHHLPADTFTKVINNTTCAYRIGLTGTVKRKDGKHFLLFDSIGETLISINPEQVKHRVTNFDYEVVNTDVKFQAPGVRRFVNGRSKSVVDFTKLLSVLVQSEKRNEVIINKITDSLKEQRVCLVISDRVEHCKLLYENILKKGFNVILLIGETRKETNWNEIREDKTIQCIIAQTSIAAEGLDYPILSALHLTCPSSNKPKLKQKIGRIRRQCEGKPFPMVYDYVDNEVYFDSDSNKPLLRGAQSRISYYKQLIAEYQKNLE